MLIMVLAMRDVMLAMTAVMPIGGPLNDVHLMECVLMPVVWNLMVQVFTMFVECQMNQRDHSVIY